MTEERNMEIRYDVKFAICPKVDPDTGKVTSVKVRIYMNDRRMTAESDSLLEAIMRIDSMLAFDQLVGKQAVESSVKEE